MATEDFTAYTEVDPNSRITVTSSRVTWASLPRNEDAYVYADKGVGHFAGDFEHLLTIRDEMSGDATGLVAFYVLANAVDDVFALYFSHRLVQLDVINGTIRLGCGNSSSFPLDFTSAYGGAFTRYLEIERDESIGTYGTMYCRIYTDSGRTMLEDTLSITLTTEKTDWRYVYPCATSNSGTTVARSGFSENLDLQEGGGGGGAIPAFMHHYTKNLAG